MMPKMYLFYTCATVSHGICLPLGMRLGISTLSICIPVFFFWLLWSVMDLCRILVVLSRENRGAFYSAKPFENVETAANGTEISLKSFQKFRKLLNFQMRTIQPKILEIPGDKLNGKTTSGKKISTIWVYLARLSPFWKFLKMLFNSLLKVVENLNRKFWLNGVMASPLSNTG